MFVLYANSVTPWVEYGAFCLAGIINAIGLLGFQHQSVSHLSGTLTLLGTELFSSPASSLHLLWVVLSFLAGAAVSGEKPDRRKLGLFMALLLGFVIGGSLGAYLFSMWAFNALLFPAIFAFSIAGAYSIKLAMRVRNEKT